MYLYSMMSNNPNNNTQKTLFTEFYSRIQSFIDSSSGYVSTIHDLYETISDTVYSDYIQSITSTCFDDVLNNVNMELYAIDSITSNNPTFSSKPRLITGDISVKITDGSTATRTIILIPIWEEVNGGYKLIDIRQHCSYAFIYNGTTTLTPTNIKVYDESKNTISSNLTFTISLFRIGNATDIVSDTFEACDVCDIELPFKNVHEVSIPNNNGVETLQIANLNFELLSGNKFIPLNSTHEYTYDHRSLIAEPMDVVHTSNSVINKLANELKFCCVVNFTSELATLDFCDLEGDGRIQFTSPMAEAQLKGCQPVQCLGGAETYLKRYLYQNCFEIVEADMLDGTMNPSADSEVDSLIAQVKSKMNTMSDEQLDFTNKAIAGRDIGKLKAILSKMAK
jgi:hypothetical protein